MQPILRNYENLRDLPHLPFMPGFQKHDLLSFGCKMGYTACVDALFSKAFGKRVAVEHLSI